MAVTNQGNVTRFITGDVAIRLGAAKIVGVVIVAVGAAAHLSLFDGVNDVATPQVFEWGDVAIGKSESPGRLNIKVRTGISATLTGVGASAYVYRE